MSSPPVFMPTATCFDDALDFFDEILNVDRLETYAHCFRVVHGICLGDDGTPLAHGWVEQLACDTWYSAEPGEPAVPREMVWQAATVSGIRVWFALARDDFYRGYRVQRVSRYTVPMATEMNHLTGHYGPWRREFRELAAREDGNRIYGQVKCGEPLLVLQPTATGVNLLRGRIAAR